MERKIGRLEGSWAVSSSALTAFLLLVAGCGGTEPPPKEPEAAPPPVSHGPKMHMQTELGQIDPALTDATFKKLQPAFMRCYEDGQKRIEFLGGDVKFFLRVQQDGHAKYAYVIDATLGDRTTERCMLELAMNAAWPEPEGGEAEVQKSMGFDPPGGVRAPTDWSPDKVSVELGKHSAEVTSCKGGVPGKFRVTLYVAPAGHGGQVTAAGISAPSADGELKSDCLVGVIKKMKLPSPGSYAAKVSFDL
jgi:hypothetical protein